MLVILDNSLTALTPTNQAEISGLESVLAASYNGEHFLTTDFKTVRSLLSLPLSLRGKAALQRLRGNISRHGHLPYAESFVIRIVKEGEYVRVSARTWTLPISIFKNKTFPQSVVLGENLLDARAYISAASQARAKNRLTESCRALPDAGGGSQTAIKLENYLNHGNGLCFCITDGDYVAPVGSKSPVTAQCVSLTNTGAWPSFATDFDGRSIENIIPLAQIEDSYAPLPIPENFHTYKKIAETDPETIKYIDAKSGLKYCNLQKMKPTSPKHSFWSQKIVKHGLQARFDQFSHSPPTCKDENCTGCTLIPGIGANTLKRVVEYFEKNTSQKLAQRVSLGSQWVGLGINIFHWTMADKPELT